MCTVKCPFWLNRLLNVFGVRIWSRLVAKSGLTEILELQFYTGIYEILAKTLGTYRPLCNPVSIFFHTLKARDKLITYSTTTNIPIWAINTATLLSEPAFATVILHLASFSYSMINMVSTELLSGGHLVSLIPLCFFTWQQPATGAVQRLSKGCPAIVI